MTVIWPRETLVIQAEGCSASIMHKRYQSRHVHEGVILVSLPCRTRHTKYKPRRAHKIASMQVNKKVGSETGISVCGKMPRRKKFRCCYSVSLREIVWWLNQGVIIDIIHTCIHTHTHIYICIAWRATRLYHHTYIHTLWYIHPHIYVLYGAYQEFIIIPAHIHTSTHLRIVWCLPRLYHHTYMHAYIHTPTYYMMLIKTLSSHTYTYIHPHIYVLYGAHRGFIIDVLFHAVVALRDKLRVRTDLSIETSTRCRVWFFKCTCIHVIDDMICGHKCRYVCMYVYVYMYIYLI